MGNTFITDTQIRTDNIVNSDGTGSPAFPLGISVSGATQFGNGTAAAPAITFTSDTDLGIFRKAANSLAFGTNNGLEVGSFDSKGAWTFGPSAGLGVVAGYHSLVGAILASNGTNARGSFSSNDILNVGANFYRSGDGTLRAFSGSAGVSYLEISRVTSGTAFDFVTSVVSQTSDSALASATSKGSVSVDGAWTLGSGAGLASRHIVQSDGILIGSLPDVTHFSVHDTRSIASGVGAGIALHGQAVAAASPAVLAAIKASKNNATSNDYAATLRFYTRNADSSVTEGMSIASGSVTIGPPTSFSNTTHIVRGILNGAVHVDAFGAAGDGTTDDSAAIQAAVNSNASLILFSGNKTYRLNSTILISSNKILDFQGALIRRGSNVNALFINNSNGTVGGYAANSNITLQNGRIDANGVTSSFSSGSFPTACSPIAFGHATNVSVIKMEIFGVLSWHCIEFNAVYHGYAIDCWFHDCDQSSANAECIQPDYAGSSGQFPWFGPYDNTVAQHIVAQNCTFERVASGFGSHSAVDAITQSFMTIRGCHFSNLTHEAVRCLNYSGVEIIGNSMTDVYTSQAGDLGAIVVQNSSDSKFNGRYVISNNTIVNVGGGNPGGGGIGLGRGIFFTGGALKFSNVVVQNNIVRNCARHGITMDAVNLGTISGNQVADCAGTGIWVFRGNRVAVAGNSAFNNASNAGRFDIAMGGGAAPDRCSLVGNSMGTYSLLTASALFTAASNQIG